ncbi:hypothetical protein DTT79_21915 [Salmonella enterica subsp. enterica]|nr:hypothetical protein [Salmonella enterica]EBI5714488.1 hypothetical protein [Salmonella enterica subsp. enterica]EBO0151575.1 hypothetical protein [Salmonella enterica subsp. enterica]ECI7378232.1 hypothetical protein [Salmonella enterica subsp. enterica]ECT7660019.1 hypothetical protein [Salmonella enterica subsp. enterica]
MGDYLHCAIASTSFYNPPNSNPLSRANTHVIDGKILYAAVTRNNELSAIGRPEIRFRSNFSH